MEFVLVAIIIFLYIIIYLIEYIKKSIIPYHNYSENKEEKMSDNSELIEIRKNMLKSNSTPIIYKHEWNRSEITEYGLSEKEDVFYCNNESGDIIPRAGDYYLGKNYASDFLWIVISTRYSGRELDNTKNKHVNIYRIVCRKVGYFSNVDMDLRNFS